MQLEDQMTKGNGGKLHCVPELGKKHLLGCDEAPDKSTTAGGGFLVNFTVTVCQCPTWGFDADPRKTANVMM